jgi:hypothetical protein
VGKRWKKRCASVALTMLTVAIACLGLAPAHADADPRFSLSVDSRAVRGGQLLTVTGASTTRCAWLLEWNGERRIGRDRAAFTGSFTAPQVTRPTRLPVQGTCFYDLPTTRAQRGGQGDTRPPGSTSRSTLVVRIPPSWRHTIVVTVLPPGSEVSAPGSGGGPGHPGGLPGGLPGTGGPALWALIAGLGALLVGTATLRRVRPPRALPAR